MTVEEADNLWDVIDEMAARAESKVMSVIAPIKKEYWAPDFQDYDVNWGNIIIPKKGLQHPLETYVLIDPFR